MNGNIIDTDYTELDSSTNEEYLTINEVSKLLDVEEFKIVYWCNKFNDILKIQSIGMYSIFSRVDIDNLRKIKHLDLDKKMSTKQIRDYIINNKSSDIIVKKENSELANVPLVQIMAKIINLQNQHIADIKQSNNEILETNKQLIEMQKEFKNGFVDFCKQISKDKEEQSNKLSSALNAHSESLEQTKSELKDYIATTIEDKLESNKNDMEECIGRVEQSFSTTYKRHDVQLVEDLKKHMNERRKQNEKENKKGFFNKIFKKK